MTTFRHKWKTLSVALALAVVPLAISVISQAPGASAATVSNPDSLLPTVSRAYCGNGVYAVSVTPAKGFNPMTATADELSVNGYPARPAATFAGKLTTWRTFAAGHRSEKSSCGAIRHTGVSAESSSAPVTQEGTSQNWSGYAAGNFPFGDAEAQWALPEIAKAVSTGVPSYSASWVAIGEGRSSEYPMVQAGSESDNLGSSGNDYYLWFEIYPEQQSQQVVDTGMSANDLVGTHITMGALNQTGCANARCTSTATCTASTCALIHLWDATTGFNESFEAGGYWNNDDHAEWIYERPCVGSGNCFPYLADAPPAFTQAQATIDGTWYGLGSLGSGGDTATTVDDINMTSCTGNSILANPLPIYSETAAMNWDGFGENHVC